MSKVLFCSDGENRSLHIKAKASTDARICMYNINITFIRTYNSIVCVCLIYFCSLGGGWGKDVETGIGYENEDSCVCISRPGTGPKCGGHTALAGPCAAVAACAALVGMRR